MLFETRGGYAVTIANSGEEALKIVKSTTDLVLLDIALPGLEGFRCAGSLERTVKLPILPSLFWPEKALLKILLRALFRCWWLFNKTFRARGACGPNGGGYAPAPDIDANDDIIKKLEKI